MNITNWLIDKDNKITNTKTMIELVKRLHGDNDAMYKLINESRIRIDMVSGQYIATRDSIYDSIACNLTRIACVQNRLGFIIEV